MFRPPEDFKPFYTRRRKKGRAVKDEIKYTEVKQINKSSEIDFKKIKIIKQDDWIKKIKIYENKIW